MNKLTKLYVSLVNILITPKSKNIYLASKELTLNILLVGFIILAFIAFLINLANYFSAQPGKYYGSPPFVTFSIFTFFCLLLYISRSKQTILPAILLIFTLFLGSAYTTLDWGIYIPEIILIYAMMLILAGILVNIRFVFITLSVISIYIVAISIGQIYHLAYPLHTTYNSYNFGDMISLIFTLAIIAGTSCLFNSEIDRALEHALNSEVKLQKERNNLAILVEERTRELMKAQQEKVTQMYRFAEFGKSASGLFHDLVNPLTLVSLNLEKLARTKLNQTEELSDTKSALERALLGTRKLQSFIQAGKHQIMQQNVKSKFSLATEITNALQVLEPRARKNQVKLKFSPDNTVFFYGDPIKFNQLITNLVANAIDSYDHLRKKNKKVEVYLNQDQLEIYFIVKDYGNGIAKKDLSKIFQPFFSTKSPDKGTGIGLSICKEIVEKDFTGQINVKSVLGSGSEFIVKIPQKLRK